MSDRTDVRRDVLLIFLFIFVGVASWSDVRFAVSEKSYLIAHKVLTYAVDDAGQPFEFVDEDGRVRGFCVDYAREIADMLGVDLLFKPMPWNAVVNSVKDGSVDMADMYYSKERARFAYFTVPFFKIEAHLIVRKSNTTIFGIETLDKVKIGTLRGDFSNEYLRDKLKRPNIFSYDTPSELIKSLANGKVDVVVGDYPTLLYYIQHLSLGDKFKIIGTPLYVEALRFVTHSPTLRAILDKAIREFERYPERKDVLIKKWFGEPMLVKGLKIKQFHRIVFTLLLITGGIIILFVAQFFWTHTLKKRIEEKTKEIDRMNRDLSLVNEELRSSMEEIEESNRKLEQYYSILSTLLKLSEELFFSPNIESIVERVLEETSNKIEDLDGVMIFEVQGDKMMLKFASDYLISAREGQTDIRNINIPEDIFVTYPERNTSPDPISVFISKSIEMTPKYLVYAPIYIDRRLKALSVLYSVKTDRLEPIELDVIKFIATQLSAGYRMYYQMKELKEMVEHDTLTGLYNRRIFESICQREIARTLRYGGTGVFAMLDLNDFKEVNDTYGHLFGDRVLMEVSRILKSKVRNVDVISRYGGDEISILFTGIVYDQAIVKMDMMNSQLQKEILDIFKEKSISISFSYGLAEFPTEGTDYDELFKKADSRLYEMKRKRILSHKGG